MKVEVDVLGFPSLIVLMVSVDVKQHLKKRKQTTQIVSGIFFITTYTVHGLRNKTKIV